MARRFRSTPRRVTLCGGADLHASANAGIGGGYGVGTPTSRRGKNTAPYGHGYFRLGFNIMGQRRAGVLIPPGGNHPLVAPVRTVQQQGPRPREPRESGDRGHRRGLG